MPSLRGDKTSRGAPADLGDTNLQENPTVELNAALAMDDRKRLSEKRPSKGGGPSSVPKPKKPDKAQLKWGSGAES